MTEPGKTDHAETVQDLRRRGYRLTPQRERILQIFHDLPEGTHLSAEELHQRLASEDPPISLATAYRTLKLLASIGVLRELDFAEGHKHYELNRESHPHQHLICVECGTTIEFSDANLTEAGRAIGQKHQFRVIDVQFKIFGFCPRCSERR
jgi:Fur family ferric uptake transcriptional regulator